MKKGFAKKSLGQNFLQSTEIRNKILEEAGNINQKNILEIGPGLGFLTTKLLQEKANVTAIELDKRAIEILQRDFSHKENFRLIHNDVLKQDFDELFPKNEYQIIANIPYNITSPILKKTLSQTKNKPKYALLMVQKEVAEKICNPKKRSILSISVEIYGKANLCFLVPKENFSPIPRVDSAIIKIETYKNPLISKEIESDFFNVIHAGFSQKRKKLGNFFGGFFGMSTKELLKDIDTNKRAETLSIEEWQAITKNFQEQKEKQKKTTKIFL